MLKINLDLPIKALDGSDIPDSSMAKLTANILASSNKGQAIKLLDMGISLFKTGELTLDQTDFDMLRGIIEQSESMTNLAKGQIMRRMDEEKKKNESLPTVAPLAQAS